MNVILLLIGYVIVGSVCSAIFRHKISLEDENLQSTVEAVLVPFWPMFIIILPILGIYRVVSTLIDIFYENNQ